MRYAHSHKKVTGSGICLLFPDVEVALKRLIALTDISHSGQLNIATSTPV